MLIYSMGVSIDGYVYDRDGSFDWTPPTDAYFAFQTEQVASLGAYLLGRRLYETMRVWDTDPALRATPAGERFAEIWASLPKVVFSRTPDRVEGNARLARESVADEIADALADSEHDVSIGGADLAAQAIELDLVDELRIMRTPVVVVGGAPYLPPVSATRRFETVETHAFDSGVLFERWRRVREG